MLTDAALLDIFRNDPSSNQASIPPSNLYYDGYFVRLEALPLLDRVKLIEQNAVWDDITIIDELSSNQEYVYYRCRWKTQKVIVKKFIPGKGKIHKFETEIELLKRIQHPSIIKLLGYSRSPYFIIYENIRTTVSVLQNTTAYMYGNRQNAMITRKQRKKMAARAFSNAALPQSDVSSVSIQIANVLAYLHEGFHPGVRIILNSLSTETIGIQKSGAVKLFDFGNCVLIRRAVIEDVVFKLTYDAGDWRYRSPEIFRESLYNQKADIFSFSIVMFQMLKGNHPASAAFSPEQYISEMVNMHAKPKLSMAYVDDLVHLLSQCWNDDIMARPNASDVSVALISMGTRLIKPYATLW